MALQIKLEKPNNLISWRRGTSASYLPDLGPVSTKADIASRHLIGVSKSDRSFSRKRSFARGLGVECGACAMMMVETELRVSPIHGIGVFVSQRVRAGELIWRFDSRIDRVFSDEELREMPELLRRFLRTYSTLHGDLKLWVLCGDNGRHFNHSDAPNTQSLGIAFGDDVAAVDLKPGTELTSDYRTICDAVRSGGLDFSHPHFDSRSSSPLMRPSPMSNR